MILTGVCISLITFSIGRTPVSSLNAYLEKCLKRLKCESTFNKEKVPEGAFCIYMHCEILNFVKVR